MSDRSLVAPLPRSSVGLIARVEHHTVNAGYCRYDLPELTLADPDAVLKAAADLHSADN